MASSAKRSRITHSGDSSDEEKNVFTVDSILNKRLTKSGKTEYLVKWAGFTEKDATWEPEEHLSCHDLIVEFGKKSKTNKNNKEGTSEAVKEKSIENSTIEGKQLRCIVGLTRAPGELHFLCKFTDDTASLIPAKEVNARYRPYVDVYCDFVKEKVERKQKRAKETKKGRFILEDDVEEEWPSMPEGIKILTAEERELQRIKEENLNEKNDVLSIDSSNLIEDLQLDTLLTQHDSLSHFLNENEEIGANTDSLIVHYDSTMPIESEDRFLSPEPSTILVDTVLNDDLSIDRLIFPNVLEEGQGE